MGKGILAEESLLNYLTDLAKSTTGFVPGLIVGQTISDYDHVLHLMRTPLHEESDSDSASTKTGSLAKISNFQESWAADHAKCVTRMLPGGMWVFGLFVIGPDDIFLDTVGQNKLRSTLVQIQKKLSIEKFLFGNSPNSEKIVLQFARSSLRYSCKSFDLNSTGSNLKSVEWRFLTNPTRWHQLKCHFDLENVGSIHIALDSSKPTLRKQLDKVLETISESLNTSIHTINGEKKADSVYLSSIEENKNYVSSLTDSSSSVKRNSDSIISTHQIDFYQDLEKLTDPKLYNKYSRSLELKCSGVLESHIFLHEKASILDGIQAVKEDILRSLFSRLEMHCETLIEEEATATSGESCVHHEPPRRVMVSLPHSDLSFYDYLFPGEGVSEILSSLQEFLDLKVDTSHINKNFEGKAANLSSDERSVILSTQGSKNAQGFNIPILKVTGLIIAFVILLISIFFQLYFKH